MSLAGTERGDDRASRMPRNGGIRFSDRPRAEPAAPLRVETSIGAVTLFPQRFEDIGAFSKLPPDESPARRLRLYLPHIAARADALIANGDARIDETSSQQISEDDLERIAEAYLSMPQREPTVDAAGPPSERIARAAGESAVAYLDRRLREDHDQQMEDLKGTYEALSRRSDQVLANALADVDRQASSLREIATRSMGQNHTGPGRRSDAAPSASDASREDAGPLLTSGAGVSGDDSISRAHDEAMALTRSIGVVTTQSAILVASLSETATRFLRQFTEATQRLEEAARTSARTVLVAVLITTALAAIAATAAILSYIDERENRQATKQWQESAVQSMKETSAAQAAQIQSLEDHVRTPVPPTPTPVDGASQKGASDTEPPLQGATKPASSKRTSKRKPAH